MTYYYNYIWGSHGDDTIQGTHRNDVIIAGSGNDTIFGGNGSDVIYAGAGDDFIIGGFGLDRIHGGSGNDTISWDNLGSGLSVDLKYQRVHFNVGGGEHFSSIENIVGSRGNDRIKGDYRSNTLSGNRGNDRIEGRGGDDRLFGDEGHDTLHGGRGNDFLNGGKGNDKLSGGRGNDIFFASTGNDRINGGSGHDVAIYSDLGQAITLKAAGEVDKGSAGVDHAFLVEEFIGATGQNNTIDNRTNTPGVSVDVNLGENRLSVNGIPGVGDRSYTVRNFTVVQGTESADRIVGDNSSTERVFFFGNGGNDVIEGGAGDDDLFGGEGNDTIVGGDGKDFLVGGGGNDVLTSLQATDVLSGTDAAHAGAHEFDILIGGLAEDRFILGDEVQTYYAANGASDFALIQDFGAGADVIVLHGSAHEYKLQSNGELFLRGNHELIAKIEGNNVSHLNLNGGQFEFV